MRTNHIIVAAIMSATAVCANAQTVVVEETFDNNELSWTENQKPECGESIIIDGEFKFDVKSSSTFYTQNSSVPQLLSTEGVMPIDPALGFEVSVDISFERIGKIASVTLDELNATCGLLLEYDDDRNFIAVAVNENTCYIIIYKEGRPIRYKTYAVKMRDAVKNKVTANLKVAYKDLKLIVLVDDVEMAEMRKVAIESPSIGLFATGKRKVSFDNVVIAQ